MKIKSFTTALLGCAVGFVTVSCEKEDAATTVSPSATATSGVTTAGGLAKLDAALRPKGTFDCSYSTFSKNLVAAYMGRAVQPSACGPTPFNSAITPYVQAFGPLEFNYYGYLALINQLYTFVDTSKQYFGVEGELTNFAAKEKRDLESFWNMPDEVTLRGEHTRTLQDRNAIIAVYRAFAPGASEADIQAAADEVIGVIKQSAPFKTTPLLAFDGFATFDNLIVIGDGIVQVMVDAGVDEKVTFTGILAHEWGHQVQFNHYEAWYPNQPGTPEATRGTELEADFFSSYFMTHKRGAAYNWKRAAEFFELFYNIGDCAFTSPGHHGTPNQRLAASRLGWIIAEETMPKGHILSADEAHAIFVAALDEVIYNRIDSSAAFASLKSSQLKAVYGNVQKHKKELQGIVSGQLSPAAVQNL